MKPAGRWLLRLRLFVRVLAMDGPMLCLITGVRKIDGRAELSSTRAFFDENHKSRIGC